MACYDVFYREEKVGCVTVEREGLYFVISCRCKLVSGLLRLILETESGSVVIGVCAPEGAQMGIRRKLPSKQLGDGPWKFILSESTHSGREVFVPLGGELPTWCLQNLERARFLVRSGQPGLLFSYLPGE